jgi:hypothetical protein
MKILESAGSSDDNTGTEGLKQIPNPQPKENIEYKGNDYKILCKVIDNLFSAKTFLQVGKVIFDGINLLDYNEDAGCKLGVYLDDEDILEMVFCFHRDPPKSYFEERSRLKDLKMFTKLAIEKQETTLIKDSWSEFALSIDPGLTSLANRTMIFIPLLYKERLIGIFSYARGKKNSIPEETTHFLEYVYKIATRENPR